MDNVVSSCCSSGIQRWSTKLRRTKSVTVFVFEFGAVAFIIMEPLPADKDMPIRPTSTLRVSYNSVHKRRSEPFFDEMGGRAEPVSGTRHQKALYIETKNP